MNPTTAAIQALFNRTPRRHSLENIKEIYSILDSYSDILMGIESENPFYEKNIAPFFDELETVRSTIKSSNSNKASKKMKDSLFDEGSGMLKESMQALLVLYEDGNRKS